MSRMLKRIIPLLVVGALAGMAAYGLAGWFGLKLPFQTTTVDRSQPVLLKSIEDLSQYHAAMGNLQVIVDVEKDVDWVPDFLAGERSLLVVAGTVNAYVDFGGLGEGDLALSEDGKTATIRLPEPKLDKPNLDLDPKRTYLYSQDRGVFNRLKDALSTTDQQVLYAQAEQKIAAAAKESDLTKQATANTQGMLTKTFGALGIKVIFV